VKRATKKVLRWRTGIERAIENSRHSSTLEVEPCSIHTLEDLRRAMGPDALDHVGLVRGLFVGEEP
jgi:hypothetical protein